MGSIAFAVLVIALGVLAARAIRRSPIRERHEVPAAIVVAAIVSFLLASFAEVVFAAVAGMDTGIDADAMLVALPFAAAVGVLGFLSGLVGYWTATRWIAGQGALIGSIVGPLAFTWLAIISLGVGR